MNINPLDFLKNFKDIQSRLKNMQEKTKDILVTGSSGGDMVKVDMDGQMNVTKVTISKEVVVPDDIEMLEDLVLAAYTSAHYKIKEKLKEEMSSATGGMNIPPDMMGL